MSFIPTLPKGRKGAIISLPSNQMSIKENAFAIVHGSQSKELKYLKVNLQKIVLKVLSRDKVEN